MAEQMLLSTSSLRAGWAVPAGPWQVKWLHRTRQGALHRCCQGQSHGHRRARCGMEGDTGMMEGDARNEQLQTRGPETPDSHSRPLP